MLKTYLVFPHAIYDFSIETDSCELVEFLGKYYGICQQPMPSKVLKKEIAITVSMGSFSSLIKAVEYIEAIVEQNFEFEEDWNVYHGSAVWVNGKTMLFLGKTHSGKTTLSAYLSSKKDVCILAEEYVIVNTKTLEVAATPHFFWLRKGGLDVLSKYLPLNVEIQEYEFYGESRFLFPCNCSKVPMKKGQLDACFLPTLKEGTLQAKKIQSLQEYIVNAFSPHNMQKNLVSAVRLKRTLPLYAIHYYDLDELYNFLKSAPNGGLI